MVAVSPGARVNEGGSTATQSHERSKPLMTPGDIAVLCTGIDIVKSRLSWTSPKSRLSGETTTPPDRSGCRCEIAPAPRQDHKRDQARCNGDPAPIAAVPVIHGRSPDIRWPS